MLQDQVQGILPSDNARCASILNPIRRISALPTRLRVSAPADSIYVTDWRRNNTVDSVAGAQFNAKSGRSIELGCRSPVSLAYFRGFLRLSRLAGIIDKGRRFELPGPRCLLVKQAFSGRDHWL
jgi:hypothetical protein